MAALVSIVSKTELFCDIPESALEREILPLGQLQEFSKGQFLIVPQQRVERFGIVISGKVQVLHLFANGNYSLMTSLRTGGIVGADLVCTKTQLAPYHAMAATAVQIFYLPETVITRPGALQEQMRLRTLDHMLTLIANENMKKEYRLAILSQKGLRERILTYLTMQAARKQKKTFTVSLSREEMASFLCVNRSALSHELSLMQQEGLISFRKNVFTLKQGELELPTPSQEI